VGKAVVRESEYCASVLVDCGCVCERFERTFVFLASVIICAPHLRNRLAEKCSRMSLGRANRR
jgi:hypothetical protein